MSIVSLVIGKKVIVDDSLLEEKIKKKKNCQETRRRKHRRHAAAASARIPPASAAAYDDGGSLLWDRVYQELESFGPLWASRGRMVIRFTAIWKRLQWHEVMFLTRHAAAICFEISCLHSWEVLACAIFQTLAYFSDGIIFFRDWERITGLPRGSQSILLGLMKNRCWHTKSSLVASPWKTFF